MTEAINLEECNYIEDTLVNADEIKQRKDKTKSFFLMDSDVHRRIKEGECGLTHKFCMELAAIREKHRYGHCGHQCTRAVNTMIDNRNAVAVGKMYRVYHIRGEQAAEYGSLGKYLQTSFDKWNAIAYMYESDLSKLVLTNVSITTNEQGPDPSNPAYFEKTIVQLKYLITIEFAGPVTEDIAIKMINCYLENANIEGIF